MTATTNREVTLTLATETKGAAGVKALADDFRTLGAEGSASAEGLEKAAASGSALSAEAAAVAKSLREQQAAQQAATIGLAEAQAVLARYRAEIAKSGTATDEQTKGLNTAKASVAQYRADIATARAEIARLSPALTEATRATKEHAAAAAVAGRAVQEAFGVVGVRSAGAIRAEITQVNQALQRIAADSRVSGEEFNRAWAAGQSKIAGLTKELEGAHNATGKVGGLASSALAPLRSMGAALAGAFGFQKFVDANLAMDSSRRALQAITGDAAKASAEMGYLQGVSARLGVDTAALARSYVGLTASAKGTTLSQAEVRGVFEAVAGSMAVLGKSSADTEGALQAVSQMVSKGTVSMEELRQQLAERLPGAMQATATALGITVGELNDLVSAGKLSAGDVLPALRRGLEGLYGTGAKVETMQSGLARATNTVTDAFASMGQSGVMAALIGIFNAFAFSISAVTNTLTFAGKAIGTFMAFVATFDLKHPIDSVRRFREEMADLTRETDAKMRQAMGAAASSTGKVGDQAQQTGKAVAGLTGEIGKSGDATQAAAGSFVQWILQATRAQEAAQRNVQAAEKTAEARKKEGDAAVALASALGTETDKREAARAAALANQAAEEAVTATRQKHIEALRAEAQVRAEALRDAGVADANRAKELVDLGERINLAEKDIDTSKAQADAYRLQAAALTTETAALQDNSRNVKAYADSLDKARAEVERLRAAKAAGVDVGEQLRRADLAAAQAAALYRDALADQRASLEASLALKRASADVEAASLRASVDGLRASAAIAQAKGDEVLARRLVAEAADKELQLASLLADAKRAEAQGTLTLVEAKRAELQAAGQLTATKEAELKAAELGAKVKLIEADAARQAAVNARDLLDAQQRNAASSREAGQAASEGAAGFDEMARSARNAADGVDKLTAAEKALGIVKRPVSTSTVDHRTLALQNGLTDEGDIAKFSDVYGKRLQESVTNLNQRRSLLGISTPQSYMFDYAGAVEEAKSNALNDVRTRDRGTTGSAAQNTAPAGRAPETGNTQYSVHTVEIKLPGGTSSAVQMATAKDSSNLVNLLGQLGTDMQRAAI